MLPYCWFRNILLSIQNDFYFMYDFFLRVYWCEERCRRCSIISEI
jgi:hypothetical protein